MSQWKKYIDGIHHTRTGVPIPILAFLDPLKTEGNYDEDNIHLVTSLTPLPVTIEEIELKATENIGFIGGEDVATIEHIEELTKFLPIGGSYNSGLLTFTDGASVMHQFDINGRLLVSKDVNIETIGNETLLSDNVSGLTNPKFIPIGGQYNETPPIYSNGDMALFQVDASGNVKVILGTDIEIGAVELKDASTDDRAEIDDADVSRTSETHVLVTQPIDASGNVLGRTAANAERATSTLVDPIQIIDSNGKVFDLSAANASRSTATLVLPTQNIDASGKIMAAGDTVGNAPFVKPTDGTTAVSVISIINALKTDESSIAGVATAVNVGVASAGSQRIVLARDANGFCLPSNYVSPQDFSVAFTTSTTVTITGTPFTVDDTNCTVTYVQIKPSGSTWGAPYVNGMDGISLIASSNVITITGGGTPFATGDTYRLGVRYQEKAYDSTLDVLKTVVQNPPGVPISDSLVDTTNVATGNYYPSSTGMELGAITDISFTGKLIDGAAETTSLTIEGTNDEDTTNGDWIPLWGYLAGGLQGSSDIGNQLVNIISATNQTTIFKWDFDKINLRYIRIKITTTAATNTVIVKMRRIY